jgi:SAM-dependent methyltransferase
MMPASKDEILWRHLRELPYFRAALRAVEDSFYQGLDLPEPVLDLGCGDGQFASVAFAKRLDVGLDPWKGPLREARTRGTYRLAVRASGDTMPFPNEWFASAVSNSVLEHIPQVDAVLMDLARVMRPGGRFVFCVPNQRFPQLLLGNQVLQGVAWHSGAEAYSRFFNRISRHVHCDPPEVWRERLARTGFEIEKSWDYFPPKALHVLEMGHYFGLPALVTRKLTGRWILAPNRANLALPWAVTRPILDSPISEQGAYTFYITRRTSAGPSQRLAV